MSPRLGIHGNVSLGEKTPPFRKQGGTTMERETVNKLMSSLKKNEVNVRFASSECRIID